MNYFGFLSDKTIIQNLKGSSIIDISKLEKVLGFKLPLALKEYLIITGESAYLYSIWDYHGTNDIAYLYEWIHEWIVRYKEEGVDVSNISKVLPFFKWQDTFFYVPIEIELENPPVYAFDIGETPTIRKLSNSLSDFVKDLYEKKIMNNT